MQIHELNNFAGTPTSSDYLAIDNSTTTTKIGATGLGIQTQMTVAEAETGTSTASRIVTPKVVHDYVTQDTTHLQSETMTAWAAITGNDGSIDDIADFLSDCTFVESGTDGIWKYHKFSDHTYHAWYEGLIVLAAGSSWAGGYFHKGSGGTPPSFSQSVTAETGASTQANLYAFCGVNLETLETYWFNGSSSSVGNFAVRLDLYGTW